MYLDTKDHFPSIEKVRPHLPCCRKIVTCNKTSSNMTKITNDSNGIIDCAPEPDSRQIRRPIQSAVVAGTIQK